MDVTKEDLAQMTPDQVAALQKQNCIFCHIISGKVSSKKIFEDDICLAILDINPSNPGHVLLLPKEHYTILPLIPTDVVRHIGQVSKYISQATLRVLKAQGTDIFIANGAIAGQKAPHFMIHIIPRRDNDDVGAMNLIASEVGTERLDELRGSLANAVAQVMKTKPPASQRVSRVETAMQTPLSPSVSSAPLTPLPVSTPHPPSPPLPPSPLPEEDVEQTVDSPVHKLDIDKLTNAILSKPALTQPERPTQETTEGGFIASTQSNRVHAKNCPLAKKIKRENLVEFMSKKEALDKGYEECDCLK